jgi:hypothetical protein
MGAVSIIGTSAVPAVRQRTQTAVFIKRYWSDPWQYVPYLQAVSARESVAPSVGTAELRYDFGLIKREDANTYSYYTPWLLNNWHCMIRGYNAYGNASIWVGTIQTTGNKLHGATYPSGEQQIAAYDLSHVLDRIEVRGSITESGNIWRPLCFNKKDGRGIGLRGNRSYGLAGNGAHVYSKDGYLWSNFDIANYLLVNYQEGGLRFLLAGQLEPLAQIYEEHNLNGMTLKQALDKLIDRRRGINYRIVIPDSGSGYCYIFVYSTTATPIATGDAYLPANPFQVVVNFDGAIDVDPNLTVTTLQQYNAIEVVGGPIYSTFTLSFADGTLEGKWTAEEQSQYGLASGDGDGKDNDLFRQADVYRNVWQKYGPPANWDWMAGDGFGGQKQNARPWCDFYGRVRPDGYANLWPGEKTFEHKLPFRVVTSYSASAPEYRRPFVLVRHPANSAGGDQHVYYIDKMTAQELPAATVSMSDRDLAFLIEPEINHVLALNYWPETNATTNTDPTYNPTLLIATLQVATDCHLYCYTQVPGVPVSDTPQVKTIHRPDLEAWYVVPGTVVDAVDGQPKRYGLEVAAAPRYLERDDSSELRRIAALASAWYGQPRHTLNYTYEGLSLMAPCAYMILGVASSWHLTDVGTCVTERDWDFLGDRTTVRTGFEELDFAAAGEGVESRRQAHALREPERQIAGLQRTVGDSVAVRRSRGGGAAPRPYWQPYHGV